MPQRVICSRCSVVLYEGEELKSPHDLIQEYEGKCPKCANKLSYIPLTIEVEPLEASA